MAGLASLNTLHEVIRNDKLDDTRLWVQGLPDLYYLQHLHVQYPARSCRQYHPRPIHSGCVQAQVVELLQHKAGVDPHMTTLVWRKLEEQSPDFFAMYHTRLKLKDQITLFNHLLKQQVCGG